MASQRLQTIASMCPAHGSLVDIGSDHGLLPRMLLKQGFASRLYATELSQDSFQNLTSQCAELPIHLYQADGLSELPGDIKTIVITGMGGQLIHRILDEGQDHLDHVQTIILGPQRDQGMVREWLMHHHWKIVDEQIVMEGEKAYPLMKAEKGQMVLDPIQLAYGPINIQKRDADFLTWLRLEEVIIKKALQFHQNKEQQARLEWIEHYVKNN
ncbi:MAG: tRNA (adenine(22)-N(1))-methyltransferase [Bacilli bacterium]